MRFLRAAAAAVALLVLLGVVPGLLVATIGWPLPRAVPAWSEVTSTLAGDTPLDIDVVWNVLAVVVWIGWAQLAVAVANEVSAAMRGRVAAGIPGLGPAQALAAWLLATASALLPAGPAVAAARSLPPAADALALADTAATTEPLVLADLAPPSPVLATVAPPEPVEHVVQRRDTLWDLSEQYLAPGGTRDEIAAGVQRIFDANAGRPQPDGSSLTDAGLLRPGWVLAIPGAAAAPAANPGVVVVERGDSLWAIAGERLGDGNRWPEIADANYGRPQPDGRTLTDPNVLESGWELVVPAPAPPEPAASPTPAPASPTSPDVGAPPSPPAPPEQPPPPAPTTAPPTTVAAPLPAPAEADSRDADAKERSTSVLPWGLAGGGVATAGLLAVLDRRRRAQLRRRAAGHRVVLPAPPAARTESELRAGADPESAERVDHALRAAAGRAGATGLPPLDRIEVTDGSVALVLDDPAPPPPGFEAAGPARWTTDAADFGEDVAGVAAPVPALIPIGRTAEDAEVLIDLETTAVTQLAGPDTRILGLLSAAAVAAATAPWADQPRVLAVGLPEPIAAIPGVEVVSSLGDALTVAEAHADDVDGALRSLRCPTTAQARAAGVAPDAWQAVVVVSAHPPDDLDAHRLATLARNPARGSAVICPVGDSPTAGRLLTVDDAGVITEIPGLIARQLATGDLDAIADLLESQFEFNDQPKRPVGGSGAEPVTSLAELLDDVDVLVRVLGEVDARRCANAEPLAPAKQKGLEAIVYLAVRHGSVDREEVQSALWPSGANAAKTFVNVMSDARRTLAAGRTGAALLPSAEDGRYHLSERVLTDYELFCRLTSAAEDLEDAEAAAGLLAEALTLVRGEPFVGVGRGYAWVAPHRGMIVAQVVDAAEELAEVRLATGDWRGAEWAARQGLRAFPSDERLYRVLMRTAHAAGSLPGVHRAYQELLAAVADPDFGCEPEDTVHPETVQLLEALTAGTRPDRASA